MKRLRKDNLIGGANNLATADRLPEGFARHAVNVDPLPGGTLASRIGYERVYDGQDVRGVLALGDNLLIADGTDLVEFNTRLMQARTLRSIAGAGNFCGDVFNGRLYFSTENECLVYDGRQVVPWGVPDLSRQPHTYPAAGTLLEGHYQIAVTYIDSRGLEGGTARPRVMHCEAGQGIAVVLEDIPSGCQANVYVSPVNGSTLYLQAVTRTPATITVSSVRDDTAECGTILKRGPRPASRIVAHNGVLLMAVGNVVEHTLPMQAHLVDRAKSFFQYPEAVGELMSADGTAYVSADKCYALSSLEAEGVSQRVALSFPAIPGTAVNLPGQGADQPSRAAWMTRYGQAVSSPGGLTLMNLKTFAPSVAERGNAGVIESNGNQLIVTTTQGRQTGNTLAAVDFYIGEILNP